MANTMQATITVVLKQTSGPTVTDTVRVARWMSGDGLAIRFPVDVCAVCDDPADCEHGPQDTAWFMADVTAVNTVEG